MSKLVIVESPAKARTLSKILGSNYKIKASMGHIRDLPRSSLGINIEDNFKPTYTVLKDKRKIIKELTSSVDGVNTIYLATDPDREGEAISWHLVNAMKLNKKDDIPVHRVSFHEITPEAVKKAFKNPRTIDMNLVNAQQARRLLDRIVGYKLSPLLWKKVLKGLSAGRVQSAAVRIIVDREKEISDFNAVEYWVLEVELIKKLGLPDNVSFKALFYGMPDGTKVNISNKKDAAKIEGTLKKSSYSVKDIQTKEQRRVPSPPFTTSTMQQEAWWRLRFPAKKTMSIAQQLYEGINIGKEGSVGLITYMRTDSTYVTPGAIEETREYVRNKFGEDYVPSKARVFSKKIKFSQEAHEAIRPTKISRVPDNLKGALTRDQFKLYDLIWKRMVASQMSEARYDAVNVDIKADYSRTKDSYLLKASSSKVKFAGYTVVYATTKEDGEPDDSSVNLPDLAKGEDLKFIDIYSQQKFTEPPPRYNEATLIKALEQKGIGRPSTYAPIISTIQDREYVYKENGRFKPGNIGTIVNGILVEHFPNIVDLNFTAKIEDDLDRIASGKKEWISLLSDFYEPFAANLEKVGNNLEKVPIESKEICPVCGKPMVIKSGRFGRFLACSGYPDCKKTMPLINKTGVLCPDCGDTEKGELVERRNKKKQAFYGCSRYPECRFTIRQKPFNKPCPECGKLLIYSKNNLLKCTNCDFKGSPDSIGK
jgi:DNA topoisomerase-1